MTTLSIIIPVYNEKHTVSDILARVQSVNFDALGVRPEIIVVDDGSQDGTREILENLAAYSNLTVYRHQRNRGKGAAIATGLQFASGEIILVQDADLEYDPADYPALVRPIVTGRAQVVYGSRIRGARVFGTSEHSYLHFYWGGRLLSWLTNLLFGTRVTDESTGYKVFARNALEHILPLEYRGFEFCSEVTAKLARRGIRIHEVPIHYYPRSRSQGKKITWQHGLRAVLTLLRYRLVKPAEVAQDREVLAGSQAAVK